MSAVVADLRRVDLFDDTADEELAEWAERIRNWTSGDYDGKARDVYVYFDNDAKVHAPHDALRLTEFVQELGVRVPGKTQPLAASSS
jgi:uncharacterized protein YecE (DUF72 family)